MPKKPASTTATKPSVVSYTGPNATSKDSMPVQIYVDTEKNELGVRPTSNGVPSAEHYSIPLKDVLDLLRQTAI